MGLPQGTIDEIRHRFEEATEQSSSHGPGGATVAIIGIIFGSIVMSIFIACLCHITKLYLNHRWSKNLCSKCRCQIALDDMEASAKPPPYGGNSDDGRSEEDCRLLDDDPLNKA